MVDAVTVLYILSCYFVLWIINIATYIGLAIGFDRWIQFIDETSLLSLFRRSKHIAVAFASIRVIAGILGIVLFAMYSFQPLEIVLILGTLSLTINTAFLLMETVVVNREVTHINKLSVEDAQLLEETFLTMDNLRRTVERRARLPKNDGRHL